MVLASGRERGEEGVCYISNFQTFKAGVKSREDSGQCKSGTSRNKKTKPNCRLCSSYDKVNHNFLSKKQPFFTLFREIYHKQGQQKINQYYFVI